MSLAWTCPLLCPGGRFDPPFAVFAISYAILAVCIALGLLERARDR